MDWRKRLDIILQGVFNLAEVKLLAGAALEDVEHVETRGLEVAGGVVRLADEHLVARAVIKWLVHLRYLAKDLKINVLKKILYMNRKG